MTWQRIKESRLYIVIDKWTDCSVYAAALSFYMLAGLISFCVLIVWMTPGSEAHILEAISEVTALPLTEAVPERLSNLISTWGKFAPVVILLAITLSTDSLRSVFDRITLTSHEDPLWIRLPKCLFKAICATILIIIATYLVYHCESTFLTYIILYITACILLWAALSFLPTDKPFNYKNAFYAAAPSALVTIIAFPVLEKIYAYLTGPLGIFLILVWLDISWLLILSIMLIFTNISKDGCLYEYKKTERIAGMAKTYLSVIITAYVFQNWNKGKNQGCSLKDIRDKSQLNLPYSMLNRILSRLEHKKVLDYAGAGYRPHPELETVPEEMTVKDLLILLPARGDYHLVESNQLFEDILKYYSQADEKGSGSLSLKIIEIDPSSFTPDKNSLQPINEKTVLSRFRVSHENTGILKRLKNFFHKLFV